MASPHGALRDVPTAHSWLWLSIGCVVAACGGGEAAATSAPNAAAVGCEADPAACSTRCDAGDVGSCADLGAILSHAAPRDTPRAAHAFERACELGEKSSCIIVGSWYAGGEGLAADAAHACRLFQRACDLGDLGGCALVGLAYASGDGVARDPARAKELLGRACSGGVVDACSGLKQLDTP